MCYFPTHSLRLLSTGYRLSSLEIYNTINSGRNYETQECDYCFNKNSKVSSRTT